MNKIIIAMVAAGLMGACGQTDYQAVNLDANQETWSLERQVVFHVDNEFFIDPPNCVIVLPTRGIEDPKLAHDIAARFGQRLTGRIPRVILPLERRRLSREQAYDFEDPGDLKRFAARERCGFFARAMNGRASDTFMLIWTEKQVGFTLSLGRASDAKVLWWAAHTARRGDGGLPITPISALGSSVMAGRFYTDEEVMASLVDDAQRRMIRTLPDVR